MKVLKSIGLVVGIGIAGIAIAIGAGHYRTEAQITEFQKRVEAIALANRPAQDDDFQSHELPEPVTRYFAFVFPNGVPQVSTVRLESTGRFRRPLTENFAPATSEQIIAIGEPALMFSATTPVLPGVWARAYDFFAEGKMEMKAKVLSLITVVDEKETTALNVISLRRWLLESALFPHALLPGGPVTWEAIDATSARAIVRADGLGASMIAHFGEDGKMTHMVAEEDGDLTTPYHGSGEHVTREDYRDVNGVMIPHKFVISRANSEGIFPFFDARVTSIKFE